MILKEIRTLVYIVFQLKMFFQVHSVRKWPSKNFRCKDARLGAWVCEIALKWTLKSVCACCLKERIGTCACVCLCCYSLMWRKREWECERVAQDSARQMWDWGMTKLLPDVCYTSIFQRNKNLKSKRCEFRVLYKSPVVIEESY